MYNDMTNDSSEDPKKEGFVKKINSKVTKNLSTLRYTTIGISIVLILIYSMRIVGILLNFEWLKWEILVMCLGYAAQGILLILII